MKKIFTVLILITVVFQANGQAYKDLKDVPTDKKGCIYGDCKEGYGIYVYKDNTKYQGDFKEGLADGEGICLYQNGDYYIGQWTKHSYDGIGMLQFEDGTRMNGEWQKGDYLGDVKYASKSVRRTKTREPKNKPKTYALIVGVANYSSYKNLKYTDDDAYIMYSFLKSEEGGGLPDSQVNILVDESANFDNIKKHLEEIKNKVDTNDTFIFYMAGHGIKGGFLPYDYDERTRNVLAYSELLPYLNNSAAKQKLVIADVCHAGSIRKSMYSDENTAEDLFSVMKADNIENRDGLAVIMGSNTNENSIENQGIRHGVFSYFIIEGLKGKADWDNDKVVTVEELFNFTRKEVRYYTNNVQNPMIAGKYNKKMALSVIKN
jgi:hypothetical protein